MLDKVAQKITWQDQHLVIAVPLTSPLNLKYQEKSLTGSSSGMRFMQLAKTFAYGPLHLF